MSLHDKEDVHEVFEKSGFGIQLDFRTLAISLLIVGVSAVLIVGGGVEALLTVLSVVGTLAGTTFALRYQEDETKRSKSTSQCWYLGLLGGAIGGLVAGTIHGATLMATLRIPLLTAITLSALSFLVGVVIALILVSVVLIMVVLQRRIQLKRWQIEIGVTSGALFLGILALVPSQPPELSGDAKIVDDPVIGRRSGYLIEFPMIAASAPNTYTFTAKGIPNEAMRLSFVAASPDDVAILSSSAAIIDIQVAEMTQGLIASSQSRLGQFDWQTHNSKNALVIEGYPELDTLILDRNSTYTFRFQIVNPESTMSIGELKPILSMSR